MYSKDSNKSKGDLGENLAVKYLISKGFKIMDRNVHLGKLSELDIIAKKENILAVVEVKTRSSIDFGLPQDFVKPKKIQLLVKAINEYVISNDLEVEVRFDIIALHREGKGFKIEHLEDAFFYF
jgi:putative endonuclease